MYKRQIMGSECGIPASKAGLGYAQAADAVKDLVADANAKVMSFTTNKLDPVFENNDLKAVSYTHLDVYKRQGRRYLTHS